MTKSKSKGETAAGKVKFDGMKVNGKTTNVVPLVTAEGLARALAEQPVKPKKGTK